MTAGPDLGSVPVVSMAWCLDLDVRRVQQLAKEGHFPKAERGLYPIAETVRAYVGTLRDQIARAPTSADEKASKARKTEAEAGLAEIELAKARGEVALIHVVAEALTHDLAVVRERFVSIPGRLAGDLTPVQRAALVDAINDALGELHSVDDLVAAGVATPAGGSADPEDIEDRPEAPAEAQPRRVGRDVPERRSGKVVEPRSVADKGAARSVRPHARGH